MFLLDTNVVSELRKSRAGTANPGVFEWAHGTPSALLFLSVVTVHEIEIGVQLAERSDPSKGTVLRAWLMNSVVPAFAERTVPIDVDVALRAASLHIPDPAPVRDAFIGATALVHGMTIVTRNVRDFQRFPGLAVLDPWT